MKKVLSISLLMILVLTAFVSCNGAVDERLWGSKEDIKPKTHEHTYAVQSDGSWKCTDCGDIYPKTDAPYFAIVENGKISKIVSLSANYKNGEIEGLTYVENHIQYINEQAKTVYLRTTENQTIYIKAAQSDVYHYGNAYVVLLEAVAKNSYHLTGKVEDLVIRKGNVVLEPNSEVEDLAIAKNAAGTDITINKDEKATVGVLAVYANQAETLAVNGKAANSAETSAIIGNGTDCVVKIDDSAEKEIYRVKNKVFDTLEEAKTEAKNTSEAVRIVKDIETPNSTGVKGNEIMKIAVDVEVKVLGDSAGIAVASSGTLEVYGKVENNKDITNDGTIRNYGEILTTGSDSALTNNKSVKNYGTIDAEGGAKIVTTGTDSQIENFGKIEVKEGSTFEISKTSKITNASTGEIANNGTIENKGTIESSGEITNSGTINNDGEIKDSGKITNEGNNAQIKGDGKIETTEESSEDSNIYVAAIGTQKYLSLPSAFDSVKNKETITMLKDYRYETSPSYVCSNKAQYSIDLNGFTIDMNDSGFGLYLFEGQTVTINDSVGSGKLKNKQCVVYMKDGSNLIINGGHICGVDKDQATIYGYGNLTINGGVIDTAKKNGYDYYAVMIGNYSNNDTPAKFVMTGGNVLGSLYISGNDKDNNIINISGGVINASSYIAGQNTTTITGGSFTGTTCFYFKAGTINISGGVFTSTKGDGDWKHEDSSCHNTGDALIIEGCNYPAGDPTVNITGGTFKGYKEEGGTESTSGNIFFKNYGIMVINYGGNTVNMTGTTVQYRNAVVASNTAEGFVTSNGYIHFTDENTSLVNSAN